MGEHVYMCKNVHVRFRLYEGEYVYVYVCECVCASARVGAS